MDIFEKIFLKEKKKLTKFIDLESRKSSTCKKIKQEEQEREVSIAAILELQGRYF